MDEYTDREFQILQWAADGPGIDSTSRECDASQDELLDMISQLEGRITVIHKEMIQEKRWARRWKSWAWWAFRSLARQNIELPSKTRKRALSALHARLAELKKNKKR
jgi:hypothetical protein